MPLTAPSNLQAVSGALEVALTWTAGGSATAHHIYRALALPSGFFGEFVQIATVGAAAVSFTDNAANSDPDPAANKHYCYLVYSVDAGGKLSSNPAFGSTFSGTNAVAQIYESLRTRVPSVLASNSARWGEMPYLVRPEKNNQKTRDYGWGVVMDAGPLTPATTNVFAIGQRFYLQLSRAPTRNKSGDGAIMEVAVEMAARMNEISADLVATKCGVPSVVWQVGPIELGPPQWLEDESMVLLSGVLSVQYRIRI